MSTALDLDALAPEPKNVILGGKTYKVYPPKIRQMIAMQRLFAEMGNPTPDTEVHLMQRIEEVLLPLIPEMKDNKELDLSFTQLMSLLQFINGMVNTGNDEVDDAKKKSDSPESLPTSSEPLADIPQIPS